MNDTQVDVLVASTSSISDRQVADLPLAGLERDLVEAILSGAPAEQALPGGGGLSPEPPPLLLEAYTKRPRRHPHRALVGVVAAAAIVAVVVAALPSRAPRSGPSDQADEVPLEVVDAAPGSFPQLLLDLAGWHVESIEPYSDTKGSMTFIDSRSDGTTGLVVLWAPASEHEVPSEASSEVSSEFSVTEVLSARQVTGVEAVVTRSVFVAETRPDSRQMDVYEATWLLDGFSLRAFGGFTSENEFVQVLTALREVERDPWLDALPPTLIWPDDQAVIDAMLVDVPLPPGFDASALLEERVRSREVVRGEVAQAVACGWVESWISATDAGDAAGVQQAVDAMAGSRDWAIVKEADPEADQLNGQLRQLKYDSIRTIAEAMPTDAVIPLDGGPGMRVRELYANWLNCHR
jgi:hypothetical protein